MTETEQEELRELQKMIDSEGWRIFVRHTQEQLDALRTNGWRAINTMEQFHFARGCMQTLENIIGHDKAIEAAANQGELDLAGAAT